MGNSSAKFASFAKGDTSDGGPDNYNKGCCGVICVDKQFREFLFTIVVGVIHILYFISSLLWFVSYDDVVKDSAYKANYAGSIPMGKVEDHLMYQIIVTGFILAFGVLSMFNSVNEFFHNWFMYTCLKFLRFFAISLTTALYAVDLLYWSDLKEYSSLGVFYEHGYPQFMTLLFMALYASISHLVDQMNMMYLNATYDMGAEKTKNNEYQTRFYGSKYSV
jgi:hypothetical protein